MFGNNTDGAARYDLYVEILYGVLLLFFGRAYNSYLFGYLRIRELVFRQLISQLLSTCIIYGIVTLAWNKLLSPICFVQMLLICLVCDAVCSVFGNKVYYKHNPPKHSIILYHNDLDLQRLNDLKGKPMEKLYIFDKQLCTVGMDFASIKCELDPCDVIFVGGGIEAAVRNEIVMYCAQMNKMSIFLPHISDVLVKGSEHNPAFSSPVLTSSRKKVSIEYAFAKRACDILAAALGIVVFSPVMAVTALLIKLYDKGPALYKQTRLTQNGREFISTKFRTVGMHKECRCFAA